MRDTPQLPLYVLCSTALQQSLWNARSLIYDDLAIKVLYPVSCATAAVREIAAAAAEPFLVCQEDVWFGLGFSEYVRSLLHDLNTRFPHWGLCGNRGARWDGGAVDFSRNANRRGLSTAHGPEPVIVASDNILLVNPSRFRQHAWKPPVHWPSLAAALPLSLECLRNGSPIFADPRLMTMRLKDAACEHERQLSTLPEFVEYYRSSFINHALPSADGRIDFSDSFDYTYVSDPSGARNRADIFDLYDQALAGIRRRPSLTICCRTQFNRPELLFRAVASFAAAKVEIDGVADVQVVLITDQGAEKAGPALDELRMAFPAAGLQCRYHDLRPARFSRADLLVAGIERAETDYVWFIDDDDYALPAGIRAACRELMPGRPRLVVGDSLVIEEHWSDAAYGAAKPGRVLHDAVQKRQFSAGEVLGALSGDNRTPLCSMLIPADEARQRLANRRAGGDYNEDYFVLLTLLTSPRIEVAAVPVPIAAISARAGENTVGLVDKSRWHLSYCTFMQEVLNDPESSLLLWKLARPD